MLAEIMLAHLVGDYLIQSHWMATEKTKRWWPAIAHGLTYTIPFVFITQSPLALLVIAVTHIVIDHYRLARHVVWFKNLLAPRPTLGYKYMWPDGEITEWPPNAGQYDSADRAAMRPIHKKMSVAHPNAIKVIGYRPSWQDSSATGYPSDTPPWLSVWLLIIADNVLHILINLAAVVYL